MKPKQLLTLFLCLLTAGFPLKVQAQDSETLRRTYQQIIELYPQNLEAARKQGNRVFEVQVLSGAALGYQYFGDYQKALELFREALAIAKSIPDRAMISQVFSGMASTYSKLGDYQGIKFFEEQLKQARANSDRLMIGITLNSLGLAYLSLPDYQKSIASYEEYLPMVRESREPMEELQVLSLLSGAYLAAGENQKQIATLQQLLTLAQQTQNISFQNYALSALSSTYELLGDTTKAISYQEEALQSAQKSQDSSQIVTEMQQLALLYGRLGNTEKLISLLEQAVAIEQKSNHQFSLAPALDFLSHAYGAIGNYAKAIELQKQSLLIYQNINQQSKIDGSISQASGLANLARQQIKIGQLVEAENNLRAAIKIPNLILNNQILPNSNLFAISRDELNVNIREVTLDIYRTLQQILVATNRIDEALEIAEIGRARAFVDLLKTNLSVDPESQQATPPLTLDRMRQIAKEQNSTLVQYSIIYNDNVSRWVKVGKKISYETNLYIWVIQPTGTITFRSVNLQPILENFKDSEGDVSLLNLFVLNARSSIFIRGRGLPIQATAETVSKGEDIANSRPNYQKLQQLYQLLIEPIADLLPNDPKQRVTFIPHESLFLLPFAALQDANGKYLIEKHTILTSPSIQVLDLTHQQRKRLRLATTENSQNSSKNYLIVGNPIMPLLQEKGEKVPIQLPSLPGSEKEAKAIASLFKIQPLIGSQATESAIIKQIGNAQVVHLATHGLLDNLRGFQSSLALTPDSKNDGFLTAREIINLKLKAELVVLSACDTGRGRINGDGVIGLSRSFIAAGAPSVIVSLWKVPDEPTADLMLSFYQNLQQTPDKAQALRQAMLTTMAKYPTPRDWAAFTLVGEAE